MEDKKIILQKINSKCADNLEVAYQYYKIIGVINNIKITHRQLQLLAFLAVKGNVRYSTFREEFSTTYSSSSATINNMIGELVELGLLVREKRRKIKVHPAINLDFTKEINLFLRFTKNA